MQIRRLSADLSVSEQITPADIPDLQAMGVETLIINRPDGEVGPDLGSARMSEAARAAGMAVRYIPYVPGHLDEAMIADFGDALALPGPAHAYCRSGTRSTHLWAMAVAGAMPAEAIIAAAATAGYDIAAMALMIEARARAAS